MIREAPSKTLIHLLVCRSNQTDKPAVHPANAPNDRCCRAEGSGRFGSPLPPDLCATPGSHETFLVFDIGIVTHDIPRRARGFCWRSRKKPAIDNVRIANRPSRRSSLYEIPPVTDFYLFFTGEVTKEGPQARWRVVPDRCKNQALIGEIAWFLLAVNDRSCHFRS